MSLKITIIFFLLFISSILFFVSIFFVFRPPKNTGMNTVRVHKGWGSFCLIVGLILAFGGVWSMFYGTNGHPPNSVKDGALISLMGFGFIGFMLPSFTRWHDVYWNEEYLEGPRKMFGPTLQFSRTKINWTDVIEFGQTFTLYYFVRSKAGEKIYFSPYSIGKEELENRILQSLSYRH